MEKRVNKAILLSFFLHFSLVCLLLFITWRAAHKQNESNEIVIFLTPPEENRQIVDSKKGEKVEKAEKSAYLGEENRKVIEQTVAPSREGKTEQTLKKKTLAKQDKAKLKPLSMFGVEILPSAASKPQDTPNWAEISEPEVASQNEYVKGLKPGEATALNTREYVFFTYFQRIRQRLDLAWKPILKEEVLRIFRQGRQLASERDHTTRTLVVLNDRGEIVEVKVLEESGTRNLDEAAVRAFNQAGPFPNPPRGLVNAAGVVEIRWDFVLRT